MAKCLRCGAGNEWIEGRTAKEPAITKEAGEMIDRLSTMKMQRDEADAYILAIWRKGLLPSPMPETLMQRLAAKSR